MKARANKKKIQTSEIFDWLIYKELTNYQALKETFQLSKTTLSQHLDLIEEVLAKQKSSVKLIRKRNVGIYLTGSLTEKQAAAELFAVNEVIPQTKSERINYLIVSFLTLNRAVTIQQLADELYVSRSTIENDLKEVKEYFATKQIPFSYSRNGILLEIDESVRRKALGEVINWYWGNQLSVSGGGSFQLSVQAKENLQSMFSIRSIENIEEVLGYFIEQVNLAFSDYEWQSLFIHLLIMTDRLTEKRYLTREEPAAKKTADLTDETQKIVAILEDKLKLMVPEREKELINRHFKLFTKELDKEELIETTEAFGDLEDFLQKGLDVQYTDREFTSSLIPHLFSALNRSLMNVSIHNSYKEEIKKLFPLAYEESIRLTGNIEKKYNILLSDDEIAFIALHFETALSKIYPTVANQKTQVLLVCNYGVGSSRLLEQRLINNFDQSITISRLVSSKELDQAITEDLVITTIPLESDYLQDIPVLQVSPYLSELEIKKVKKIVDQINEKNRRQSRYFTDLIAEENVLLEKKLLTYQQMIEKIGTRLIANGYAKSGVIESALVREEISLTSFENISLPHADIKYVLQPAVFIAVCPKGIQWGENTVQIVFFMAMNNAVNESISEIYKVLTEVIDNKELIHQLIESDDAESLVQKLMKGVG